MHKKIFIPSGFESFGTETFFTHVLFQEVQGDFAYNGKIFGGVSGALSLFVFTKNRVQSPMQGIFHDPMASDILIERLFCIKTAYMKTFFR
ncbi:hypothetical protein Barb6XT_02241 [Bacteroidales bacterium Barb6XT]|nr:hypothetical protein Barb6XT_02241 [Bacteroidales bacterium Barb6XT]